MGRLYSKEAPTLKIVNISTFLQYLFNDEKQVMLAAKITRTLLDAQLPRLSNTGYMMKGKSAACYKVIQRVLARIAVKQRLLRLFQEEAEFVIADLSELPRSQAPKTAFAGTLSDEKTPGYWLLVLSTPFSDRDVPFHLITYSS